MAYNNCMSSSFIELKIHIAKKDLKAWILGVQCRLWCFTYRVLKPGRQIGAHNRACYNLGHGLKPFTAQ